MFTFGIFSTHIPYIAFVFFYAFFFLFGYQRAGEPKMESKTHALLYQNSLIPEKHIDTHNENFYFPDLNTSSTYQKTEGFRVHRKTDFQIFPNQQAKSDYFGFSNFSRPPPAS